MEKLQLRFSDHKYRTLMALVEDLTPPPDPEAEALAESRRLAAEAHAKEREQARKADDKRLAVEYRRKANERRQLLDQAKAEEQAKQEQGDADASQLELPKSPRQRGRANSARSARSVTDDEFYSCDEGEDEEPVAEPARVGLASLMSPSMADLPRARATSVGSADTLMPGETRGLSPEASADELRVAKHVQVQASFSIGAVAVVLLDAKQSREVKPDEREMLTVQIVELAVKEFVMREDMQAHVTLAKLEILDCVSVREYVLESNPVEGDDGHSSLVDLKYAACPATSVLLGEHNNTLMAVTVGMGHLRLCVAQDTVRTLLTWAAVTFDSGPKTVEVEKPKSRVLELDSAENADDAAVEKAEDAEDEADSPAATSSELVQMKADITIGGLELLLATDKAEVASASLSGLSVTARITSDITAAHVELSSLQVLDLTGANSLYPTIVSVDADGSSLLVVDFQMFTQANKADTDLDMKVQVLLNRIRVNVLMRFITDMSNFAGGLTPPEIQHPTPDPSAAPARAPSPSPSATSAMAAQAAASTAIAIAAAAVGTKIGLDVTLNAPHIVVPTNSQATAALCLDLGTVSITNKVQTTPLSHLGVAKGPAYAVVDEITLVLDDLRLEIKPSEETPGTTLLQPARLELEVQRCLTEKLNDVPDIKVTGSLPTLLLALDDGDYTTVMGIVTGNLQEKSLLPVPTPPEPIIIGAEDVPKINGGDAQEIDVQQLEHAALHDPEPHVVSPEFGTPINGYVMPTLLVNDKPVVEGESRPRSVSMAVRTAMEQNQSKLEQIYASTVLNIKLGGVSLQLTKSNAPLAHFRILDIGIDATIESDGAIVARVSLHEIVATDDRKDSGYVLSHW